SDVNQVSESDMALVRVFIASGDEKLRLALMMFVDKEEGMAVVGLSDRLSGLLTQLRGSEPDALLLDLDMPSAWKANLLRDLHTINHRPMIVVFTNRPEEKESILQAGADYFIAKDAPPDELVPILNDIKLSRSNSGTHVG
ncbi:MAG: response regulator, partial [Chloroflexota bacterium]